MRMKRTTLLLGLIVAGGAGMLAWWHFGKQVPAGGTTAPAPAAASSAREAGTTRPALAVQEAVSLPADWGVKAAAHPALAVIVDPSQRLPRRLETVAQWLQSPVTPEEVVLCAAFLCSPVPSGAGPEDRERALRNDLLNALRSRTAETAGILVPVLAAQAGDPAQDEGLRTYAVQHLASWMPDLPADGRQVAEQTLRKTLATKEAAHAGTALLGLYDLSGAALLAGAFDAATEARRMALDERCDIRSRLTALALCRQTGVADPRLADMARRWIADPSVPEVARRAAGAFISSLSASSSGNPSS
ncbi:hypothetical protein OpiT1DRAFT_05914 [Opitutaceae bacterium TAV1]|nr:hypothetical protein OpiT1DRAFT_05914 [Opitutaceae bacterium TAV1]